MLDDETFGVATGKRDGRWAIWLAKFRGGKRVEVTVMTPDEARELAQDLQSAADRAAHKEATDRVNA